MTKVYNLLFLTTILLQYNLGAQNAQGCDGSRYYYDIFEEVSISTVYYGTNSDAAGNSFDLEMDIYEPVGDTQSKRPLIIWAHGGAFVTGDRVEMDSICKRFTTKGFVNATVSYRLYPLLQLGIPDSIQMLDAAMKAVGDLKAAIRHFRQDAATTDQYRIDPDRIFLGGLSAGSIMAIHGAYLDADDVLPDYMDAIIEDNGGIEGTTGDTDNQSYSSSDIFGVINLSGGIHKTDWIQADESPIASYHGTADDVVPFNHGVTAVFGFQFMSINGSGSIHNRMEELGMNHFLVAAPGADHETAYNDPSYSSYQETFVNEGQIFIYDLLCQDIALDADEISTVSSINAFPNPSDDLITLDLKAVGGAFELSVYNIQGQLVWQSTEQQVNTVDLHKNAIGTGMFIVEVTPIDRTHLPSRLKIIFE